MHVVPNHGDDPVRATDGRVPGRRGIATRQRLLECTAELLERTSYRDIKVIDIAKAAGTSPATFYQYFAEVQEAVLVLAQELAEEGAKLADLARGDWRGPAGVDTARQLVEGFLDFYERHRATFRVVDLATDEGDLRFRQMRTRTLSGLTDALVETMTVRQAEGKLSPDVDPKATAFVLVAMLAHCAAHRYGFEFWGVRTAAAVDTLARIVHQSVTGRKA